MKLGLLPNAFAMLLLGFLLTGCGGGSGTDGGLVGGGTDGTGGGDGVVTPPSPTITLSLVRLQNGEEVVVDRVDPSNPATVVATLANTDVDAVVTFSTSIGQFDPASGTVLARDGEARIVLEAGTVGGAGVVEASVTIDGVNISSNTVPFEVLEFEQVEEQLSLGLCTGGADALDCGSPNATFLPGDLLIDLSDSDLPAGIPPQGSAQIQVVVADVSTPSPTPQVGVNVTFSSRCTNLGTATISQTQSDSNGVVTAIYQADGCEGTDAITAVIPSLNVAASDSIFVYSPGATDIVFDSVQNTSGDEIDTIFIRDSGGASTARVIFRVLDSFGDPKPDQDVTFSLTTTIGDLRLENTTRQSDADGFVVAFVNAGFIATTVRVRARINVDQNNDGVADGTKSTLSDQLSVNTGIADQNSFSISASRANVEGEYIDGATSSITVRLSDLFNNPVRDGTTVQFRTEYGSINPACNTVDGACTVSWTSQNPRRPLDPNVVVPLLNGEDNCPSKYIYEETVTINSDLEGYTLYRPGFVGRIERADDVLIPPADITLLEDEVGLIGFKCDTCAADEEVKISYERLWLDEDVPVDENDFEHTISQPGIATAPFVGPRATSTPCLAESRAATEYAPAYNFGLGQVHGGRSTVLAFAQGEESFTDTDGDGIYDEGEPFVDLPEAFLDVNEDDVFGNGNPDIDDSRNNDPESWNCYGPAAPLSPNNPPLNRCYQTGGDEDLLIDFNQDGLFNAGNGIYNGTLCPEVLEDGSTPTFCSRELVNIREEIIILSADNSVRGAPREGTFGELVESVDLTTGPGNGNVDSNVDLVANDGSIITAGTPFTVGWEDNELPPGVGEYHPLRAGSGGIVFYFGDAFNGRLAQGSAISVNPDGCALAGTTSEEVLSSGAFGVSAIGFSFRTQESPVTDSGTALITVTPSSSGASQFGLFCTY